jgi:hypothetical protein
MDSHTVKLKVNLKVSSTCTLRKGQTFSGPFEELPEAVQRLITDDSRHIEVSKCSDIVEVPEEVKTQEVAVPAGGVEVPAVVTPAETTAEVADVAAPEVADTKATVAAPKKRKQRKPLATKTTGK